MGFLQPVVTTLSHILFSGPVHLLCFSSLLGTQLYQSFVITKVVFQALPRQPFTTLQARLFPVYFRLQTALLILTILTWPPRSLMSLVVSETSSKAHWIPLAVGLGAAVLNLVLFGPRARQIMLDMAQIGKLTHHQEFYARFLPWAKIAS